MVFCFTQALAHGIGLAKAAAMRPETFSSRDRLAMRRTSQGFWAFFPNPLPRRLDVPTDLAVLLDEATGAVYRPGGVGRGALRAL
jgi:hypothetical protein